MMGVREAQGDLFRADTLHLDYVGRDSFHAWLATEGRRLFLDEDFREFYVLDNGRRSVPPSQLVVLLLLQGYHRVSDFEAMDRSRFDLRWKVALGLHDHEGLCAKSTMQQFRSKLNLHAKGRELLEKSVCACRAAGVFKTRHIKAAIDTSPIFGRGAVKDTYNLVADGVAKLLAALTRFLKACGCEVTLAALAQEHDFSRYISASSIKGAADLDWSDKAETREFLAGLVADTRRAVRLAREQLDQHQEADAEQTKPVEVAIKLLEQLLIQDVEVDDEGKPKIKRGVAKDRVLSVHDPEMRHGRKSKMTRFDGHRVRSSSTPTAA